MRRYVFGIPDGEFLRGDVPMTKEEIRAIALSKLRLERDSIVWDIGAGTGSVAIEAALLCGDGTVYAIERDPEALGLLRENSEAFGTENLVITEGKAPEVFASLPEADRVFIGGSGKYTQDILDGIVSKPAPPGVVVVNSITLETAYLALKFFEAADYEVEMICVNIAFSRVAGNKTMMMAKNPVYILSAQNHKGGDGI